MFPLCSDRRYASKALCFASAAILCATVSSTVAFFSAAAVVVVAGGAGFGSLDAVVDGFASIGACFVVDAFGSFFVASVLLLFLDAFFFPEPDRYK